MNDLLGGHIPIMFDTLTTVLPAAAAGISASWRSPA